MKDIISPFQLVQHKVAHFNIEQKEATKKYKTTHISLGADYSISDVIPDEEKFSAQVSLQIDLRGTSDCDESLFEIELEMIGQFTGDTEALTEEKFAERLKINGLSTLMQLSRAYVTSATALSGFPQPVNFPMVNVYELIKSKESNESN